MISKKLLVWCCALGYAACLQGAQAASDKNQQSGSTPPSSSSTSSSSNETIAKPLSAKEKKKKEEKLRKELASPYKKWLNEDVVYIITDEEKKAFKSLQTDEEREQFIEQFWLRRDPTPDTVENEYKEEHYRRIAYSNEHYASGIPGWKTDRGRMYIMYGAPDEIESHPVGGTYERPMAEGGGETSTYPFEDWRYRYIEGVGQDVVIEFVDPTETGEYHITIDPEEKDALKNIPGAGSTIWESMGMSDQSQRANGKLGSLTPPNMPTSENQNEFTKLERLAALYKAPVIKFKDLEAQVNSRITYNLLPVKVRADFIKMTESTVLTSITVQIENKDLQFKQKD
ncbi:MAG: GWxTD domain-containing protein, partial [Bryobacteraceae bacterium]